MMLCLRIFKASMGLLILTMCSLLIANVHALCSGVDQPLCLENMDQEEASEKLDYILSKYEEVNMKVIGTPLGVHGKRITDSETEESHIVFQYIDHTVHDIMQTCAFILTRRPGTCETISTVCNTFLQSTPRPLLQREDLTVCEDESTTASDGAEPTNEQQALA